MSRIGYDTYSRMKSQIMFGLCVVFTVVILAVLGLVTGFLTFKGYRGITARPAEMRATVVSVANDGRDEQIVTVTSIRDDGKPAERRFHIGPNVTISIDGKDRRQEDESRRLRPGMVVDLRYSTADPTSATAIFVDSKYVDGNVVSVGNGMLEVARRDGGAELFKVPDHAQFTLKDEPFARLNDFKPGNPVRVRLSAYDSTQVIAVDSPIPAPQTEPAESSAGKLLPPIISRDPVPAPLERAYPGGLRNGIIGTLILIGLASLVGIPVGMLAGVYLAEYSSNSKLAGPVRFIADVLTGVPSIVVGILGYELLVLPFKEKTFHLDFNRVTDIAATAVGLVYVVLRFSPGPWRNLPSVRIARFVTLSLALSYALLRAFALVFHPSGFNGWAGSLALAFIMIPLVARTTEEMLLLVPRSYREASIALGATKARTILKVVLPAAAGSVITGIMLAIARVAGETAPLLFTVGGLDSLELNPNKKFPALTLQIYKDATNADDQFNRLAWAGILILLVLIFVLNVVVRSTAKAMARARTTT